MTAVNDWFQDKKPSYERILSDDDLFIPTWILGEFNASVTLVYAYLCWLRWYEKSSVAKSDKTYLFLAEKLGLSRSSIYLAINTLASAKLIEKGNKTIVFLDKLGQQSNPDAWVNAMIRLPRDVARWPNDEFTSEGKLILSIILSNQKDGRCDLGFGGIGRMIGASFASVRKFVNKLVQMGFCTCTRLKGRLVILDLNPEWTLPQTTGANQ